MASVVSEEISIASELLFSRLTFQEKSLAKDLVVFSNYDKATRTGRYRAPVLQLDAVMADLAADSKGDASPPMNLLLYCDVLICNGTVAISSSKTFAISILARKIVHKVSTPSDVGPAIQFQVPKMSYLTVWAQELPDALEVEFTDSGKTDSKNLVIPTGSPGLNALFNGSTISVTARAMPSVELGYENWVSLLNEDGSLKETPFLKDNIPRMLQFQFLAAASQVHENPQFALRLLNWICTVTSTTTTGSMLNFQAQSLRNSLSIDAAAATQNGKVEVQPMLSMSSVPSVNIHSCKQILKSRIQAASAFELSFQNFMAEERNSTNFLALGNDLVVKGDNALQEYKFLRKVAKTRYEEAAIAHKTAEERFKATQALVDARTAEFEKNVKDWQSDLKVSATWEILKGVVEIGIAVAATVATAGAAAPTVALAGASVVSNMSKAVQLWEKVKKIIAGLKEIYEHLKPTLEALGELVEKVKVVMSSINNLASAAPSSKNIKQADMTLDALSALSEWDKFGVQIETLKDSLTTCDIKDKDQYFQALKFLVIDGKSFIQAQTDLVKRGDDLAIVTFRLSQQEREGPRLEQMLQHFQKNTALVQILKIAMFDRLLAIRSLVFIDFHCYVNAYMFHSLETYVPVKLSPVKPVVDYLADAATLQSAVSAFGSKVCVQRKMFSISYDAAQAKQWVADLSSGAKIEIQVSPDDEQFEGVCCVRLSQARFSFVGAAISGSPEKKPLRLSLSTGRQFYDIGFPSATPMTSLIRSFTGEKRRVIFERDLESDRIQCDGDFGLKEDYLMQTPFTSWSVDVAVGGLPATAIDVQGVIGATLDLNCEASFLP